MGKRASTPMGPLSTPAKAPVLRLAHDLDAQCRKSVVEELQDLLARALLGEFVGLGVVLLSRGRRIDGRMAGELALDPARAAGYFLRAAMKSSGQREIAS